MTKDTIHVHILFRRTPRFINRFARFAAIGLLAFGLQLNAATPATAMTRREAGISTNATLLRMNDVDLDNRLSDIKRLGATWIRVDFSWPAIQPDNAAEYNWGMYDRVVHAAGGRGIKVLAVLDYTPAWAREVRCDALVTSETAAQKCNPRSSQEFAHFAAVAALRYKHQNIRAWEIWNEPNLSGYWKTAQSNSTVFVDPVEYARLANATAAQIRYHDPDSVIITGGLAPMFEPRYPIGMRQSDYLAQILHYLHADLFDGVGIHPYTWPILPNKAATYNAFYTVDNGRSTYNLRTILTASGWGDKEIWATEFGASTTGRRSGNSPAEIREHGRPDHVTEAVQAQIIQQGIDDWYDKSNVGPLFVHADSDEWLSTAKRSEAGFGLRRGDGTKKPAYNAFQAAVRHLR